MEARPVAIAADLRRSGGSFVRPSPRPACCMDVGDATDQLPFPAADRDRRWVAPERPPAKDHAVSQSEDHLKAGQLGTADVTASTVANIGPGIDFYFAFGVIAVTAGVAAPLTILAAGVAVVLLAFTVAEFTKAEPSAGSFITYVETSLGPRAGVATALLVAVGYTVAIAGVFTMSGGMVALTLAHYTSWHPPWEPLYPRADRRRHLADRARRQALDQSGGRGRARAGGDHGRRLRHRARRPACPALGHTVLVGASHRWPDRPLGRLPAGPLHVHRLGERPGARRGVPQSEAHRPEGPLHLDRDRRRPLRLLRLCHRHRLPLRRLLDRSLVGPVPDRGRPVPRRSGRPGLDRRHRLGARHPGRRRRTPRPACSSTAAGSGSCPAWLGHVRPPARHAGQRAARAWRASGSGSSGSGGCPT